MSSTRNRSPRFDCELPPEVRAELVPSRRPRILKRLAPDPTFRNRLVLASLAIAMALGGIATVILQPRPVVLAAPPLVQTPPTPASVSVPTPQAAPLLVSSPNDERFFAPEVRRAEPVGLEARMPYGESVHIRILGTLPDQESLPLIGNHIGDTYHVGDAEFVWVAPGSIGQWIDP